MGKTLLQMLADIFGKNIFSKTIGTRTNVLNFLLLIKEDYLKTIWILIVLLNLKQRRLKKN